MVIRPRTLGSRGSRRQALGLIPALSRNFENPLSFQGNRDLPIVAPRAKLVRAAPPAPLTGSSSSSSSPRPVKDRIAPPPIAVKESGEGDGPVSAQLGPQRSAACRPLALAMRMFGINGWLSDARPRGEHFAVGVSAVGLHEIRSWFTLRCRSRSCSHRFFPFTRRPSTHRLPTRWSKRCASSF